MRLHQRLDRFLMQSDEHLLEEEEVLTIPIKNLFSKGTYIYGFVASFYNESEAITNMIVAPYANEKVLVNAFRELFYTPVKPEEHFRDIEIRIANGDKEGLLLVTYDV